MPSPDGRSPSRRDARSYEGGWADYVKRREARGGAAAPPAPKPAKAQPKRRRRRAGKTELERLEAEIAAREQQVADLERRLADDWTDVDMLAAHRQARDDLQGLLQRWETLFERAQS